MAFETPDLSNVPTSDLTGLMLACAMSDDPSDKALVKACRDEIARRKLVREGRDRCA